ncbi:tRNA preQ1(34) S-adenosylmethionine ribosyltransferase-isomerase QueA [bacterium]|nr:tRNA preQ1(34) S-adenosylmethionine ribosyltransferase-isomerase QueA [bacterium]
MKLTDFDYNLRKDLIAQFPLEKRDRSRLLILDREDKSITHKKFHNIVDYFNPGDLLILNNTKVILARLFGFRKKTGGKVEALLLERIGNRRFRALIKPLKRLKINEEVRVNNNGLTFKLIDYNKRIIEFNKKDILGKLNDIGHVPLPQYIKREDSLLDRTRYQTVYAKREGAVAAPTAGLHFTDTLLKKIKKIGVNIAFITLHVGYPTFAPIKKEDISNHKMEREYFEIPKATIKLIKETKNNSQKIFAVGTTTCRALEANRDKILNLTIADDGIKGYTDLFIYPPFKFRVVDSLITNFHLPKSTLFVLVSAFAGLKNIKKAYQEAIVNRYRFFSYGDATLVL